MLGFMKKKIASFRERPFLKVNIMYKEDGSAGVDADFNKFFIFELDKQYRDHPMYSITLDDNEKVAFYLFDVVSGIAGPIVQNRPDAYENDGADTDFSSAIPELRSGGARQVVDLGDPNVYDRRIHESERYNVEEG